MDLYLLCVSFSVQQDVISNVIKLVQEVRSVFDNCKLNVIPYFLTIKVFFCFSALKMDVVLDYVDHYFFTPYVYPSSWPEDDITRQIITLLIIVNISAALLYLAMAAFSYYFVFDHTLLKHPLILEASH